MLIVGGVGSRRSLAQARSSIMARSLMLLVFVSAAGVLVANADRKPLNGSYSIEHNNIGDLNTIVLMNTATGE